MINNTTILVVSLVYFLGLFLVALYTERKKKKGYIGTSNPLIYVLTLGVYATAWTFYGSVGSAANSSFLFLSVYIAPTLMMFLAYAMLKRLVRIKNEFGITSIADYLSNRYGKSHAVGIIATLIALIGGVPYFALQIKAVIASYSFITLGTVNAVQGNIELVVLAIIIIFTIFFGFRTLTQDETHTGLIMVVAIQSIVKLVALVGVGLFAVYFVFNGSGDIYDTVRLNADLLTQIQSTKPTYSLYLAYFILSMGAIVFLPHMFHVMVVENTSEKHIKSSVWMLPVYLILVTIFTFPIAMAGIILTKDSSLADLFTLVVPVITGNTWLALLVFIGGLSAAFSMIMISTVAITTMVANNLVTPVLNAVPWLGWMRKFVLQIRWLIVAIILGIADLFVVYIGDSYVLVKIGIISFAAAFQFGPSLIGGIFWKLGSRVGALVGLWGGFAVWIYTSLVPAFVRSGWISQSLLDDGPFGIGFLRPEHLFGITTINPLAVTVLFSLLINAGLYVVFSYLYPNTKTEQKIADDFVGILEKDKPSSANEERVEMTIRVDEKKNIVKNIFTVYLSAENTPKQVEECFSELQLNNAEKMTLSQLTQLNRIVEKKLASIVGGPTAGVVLSEHSLFTDQENEQLTDMYTKLVAELKITPEEFTQKINYYLDREKILTDMSKELEEKVKERTVELEKTNSQLQEFNKFMVGRELKMVELKKQIETLKAKVGDE